MSSPGGAAQDAGELPEFARLMLGRAQVPAVPLGWMLGCCQAVKAQGSWDRDFPAWSEHSPVQSVHVNKAAVMSEPLG